FEIAEVGALHTARSGFTPVEQRIVRAVQESIEARRVEDAARRRLLLCGLRADGCEPSVARAVTAARVDDDVGGDATDAGSRFDFDAGDARWRARVGEQPDNCCALDDSNAVALCDIAAQHVFEHDTTTGEEA